MNELDNPADKWYLKTPDGERFGPVTLATLQRWAEQGRVMPGTLISVDEQKWKPAHLLDALAMDCVVRTGPSTFYGPIHSNAVDVYIRDGIIPANSAVYATRSSEAARLVEKLETQYKDEHTSRQHEALLEAETQLAAALTERDAARQTATELRTGLQTAGAEIQRLSAELSDSQTLHADAEARFQETLHNLEIVRGEKDALDRKKNALDQELELLRDKQAATSQSLADNKAILGQFYNMVQNFNEKLHHLSDECARLQPPEPAAGEPPPTPSEGNSLQKISIAAFDPTVPDSSSPLARLENQVRAELANLKNAPEFKNNPGFPFAGLFKKSAPK